MAFDAKPKEPGRRPALSRRDFLEGGAALAAVAAARRAAAGARQRDRSGTTRQAPDLPRAQIDGRRLTLENARVAAEWELSPGGLRLLAVRDPRSGQSFPAMPVFSLRLSDGAAIASSAMAPLAAPRIVALEGDAAAARLSDRVPGQAIALSLEARDHGVRVEWRGVLREGSHYLRQEVTIAAQGAPVPVAGVTLVDIEANGPHAVSVAGETKGSPIVTGSWFAAFEHPLSESVVTGGRARCSLARALPLAPGRHATYSSVVGTTGAGQLRRDFLRYVERERAHPYRTFLHYNSWYDLGYFTPYDEAAALDAIRAFGEALSVRRGVVLDSFLFDDGWDDHQSLWAFNGGFARGFAALAREAARYRAAPGVWLSPWGGYDGPRKERLAYGATQGFEENAGGFELSGPRYFERFRDVCLGMIQQYGVNQFKFDGTGNAATVVPGSAFDSDFDAMIGLIGELRAASPSLYVNLTTGTYPSPFWLRHADSIWRGGEDHSFAGVGTDRQQWITYRDAATWRHVVGPGPLFPLNALMLHGIVYARHAERLGDDPGHDFRAEVRSYFGSGTQLQELYVSHSLLGGADWDELAAAARWSRARAGTLADTHWFGGDPGALEVYGWAAWSPGGGLLTLRNPGAHARTAEVDPHTVFELPPDAPEAYTATVRGLEGERPPIELRAGRRQPIRLEPFDVVTLDAAAK